MSQGSVSSQELLREIDECIEVHDKLLEFSKQGDTLILPENMAQHQFVQRTTISNPVFEQAVNTPSPTVQQFAQGTTIPNPTFQQGANMPYYLPLPPSPAIETRTDSWTNEEKITLEEHYNYHKKMILFLDSVRATGPVSKVPKPPKRKLQDLFSDKLGKKKKQEEMTPQGFHNYFQQHIQDMTKSISREAFLFKVGEHVSIEEGVEQLKNAYKHLCRQNSQSMYFNCDFGLFLNELYKWYEQKKIQGFIVVSWQVWLNTHINISASHARNLRQLGILLNGYPKLKSIDLPLYEILKNQKLLKEMLAIPECAAFWKEGIDLPLKTTSSQEQVAA